MRSRFLRALFICLALATVFTRHDAVRAVSNTVVISEFRVRGPQGGNDEFVELYNASASAVAIGGFKINGSNNAGTASTRATIPAGVTLQPGCYYLITNTAASGYSGGVAGDLTYATGVTDDGGIALLTAANVVVDAVGLSAGSAYKEGTPLASLGTTNADRGYERKPGGAAGNGTDTDNNVTDFQQTSPSNPQNSSSACIGAGDAAPTVSSTTPANGATNVATSSTITINFSESVTASPTAFSLTCSAGGAQVFGQSASPASIFTLTPNAPLPAGTSCTVQVTASQVTDTDNDDPPDAMAANYSFSFTTLSAVDAAPAVTTVFPVSGATSVPVNTAVIINFSESVSATGNAFALQCPVGVPQLFSTSASPATSFTLTPLSPLPYSTVCTVSVAADQISDTDANDPPDSPVSNTSFSFTTVAAPPPGAGIVRINEMDTDTPGDDQAEFIELYDGGVGQTSLNGLTLVFYEGGTGTGTVTSYAAYDLDGYTTDANGYFVVGDPGVPNAQLMLDPGQFGAISNGPDAIALYIGDASQFPNGTILTTANLQDAIVYGTDDPNYSNLAPLLNPGQPIANENAIGNGQFMSNQRCPNGLGGFRNTTPYYPGPPTPGAANTCPSARPPSDVVISQLYGGGGNAGAAYQNDFVELYNRGANAVDLTGWSLQYAAATGNGWDFNKQPLGGSIGAGEYYLIALASNGAIGSPLPAANISGLINMSGTSGKIALVGSFSALVGNCPIFDPTIKDLVGYGAADCGEGATKAPAMTNATGLFRKGNGSVDTDVNANDFDAPAAPSPRRTAPIVELGPNVLSTDPRTNGTNAPRDATILVTFTEPVETVFPWFNLACTMSGNHNSATFATNAGGRDQYITPNANFTPGEQCTVTIFKNQIHDLDLDDAGPNTDTLPADYSWSFTVASGTEPPYPPSVHLTMGNPTGANSDPANYLMTKPEFALSYNRDLGRPNWVSWHLSTEWVGSLARVDTFRPDPQVPPEWYRVQSFDFSGSGFDRGHLTPNADRDKETSSPINQATFLMSNMMAQAPGNNQGPWAAMEADLRVLVESQGNELYIIAGPQGSGGTGSNGGVTTTLANGHVSVPAYTWKVALVLPKEDGNDLSRVNCSTRTIAVIMPNVDSIRSNAWQNYLTTVDNVEALTGYDFFSELPEPYQRCIEAGINGNNPPFEKGDQTINFAPLANRDFGTAPFSVAATGGASGNPVTFVASGVCTSSGVNGSTITLDAPGTCTVTASQAGSDLYNAAQDVVRTFTVIQRFTIRGFYQPVDMSGVWNIVKGGSTVPLKFEVFAGSTELTSTSVIVQPLTAMEQPCTGGPTGEVEIDAPGNSGLRYEGGMFIYNWKTPKKPGFCYTVTVTLTEGTQLTAKVQLR